MKFKSSATLIYLFTLISIHTANAQYFKTGSLIGINPSVTVEPSYQKGELDINILPVVYQRILSKKTAVRLTSIVNLGIRNSGNAISHLGGEAALLIYLSQKEEKLIPLQGLYIAPAISFTRNRIEKHTNTSLWIEPGYQFMIGKKYAISLGIQLGGTYFNYDDIQNEWRTHFGTKVVLGRWLRKNKNSSNRM